MDNIRDIVHQVIGNMSNQSADQQEKLCRVWAQIVNESGSLHTKVAGVKEGKVYIHVDSPVWLFQMKLRSKKILEALQEEISDIKMLHFKIGKIK